MLQETGPGTGYYYVTDPRNPHLGGNILGGDPNSSHPALWDWLLKRFGILSVFDVGCGEGQAMEYFHGKGCRVLGLEGLPANAVQCQRPVVLWDLSRGPFVQKPRIYDLAWCCEVAEHLDERHAGNLAMTLACAKVIALTHAIPGQGGHHHVNCRPQDYWVELLNAYGFRLLEEETAAARALAPPPLHFGNSGLIFVTT